MAKQTINIGTTANDGTGDPIRAAFGKVNDNFTEIYTANTGTNTGDETLESIKSKLGITTLSGSNTGDQDLSAYATITGVAAESTARAAADIALRLPVASGLIGAWDSDLTTLSSGKIASWTSLLGDGNHLVNATTAQQWTWDARGAIAPGQSVNRGYALTTPLSFNPRSGTIIVIYQTTTLTATKGVATIFFWANAGGAPGFTLGGSGPLLLNGPSRSGGIMPFESVNCISWAYGASVVECGSNGVYSTAAAFTSTTVESMTALMCWPANSTYNINWDYPVKAIFVYNRPLSRGEIQRISTAYGVVPPRQKVIVNIGDSITKGFTVTDYEDSWTRTLAKMYGATGLNAGFSGLTADAAYTNRALYVVPTAHDVTITVALGTNDLAFGGSTATLQANLQNLCTYLKTTYPKAKLIVQSILPRTAGFTGGATSAGFETDRATVNVWLAANWATFADAYMDFQNASYSTFNTSASTSTTSIYFDAIHPTSATHLLMGAAYYGKITW
jgi:lysophospholipase L1-like esterase